MQVLLAADRCDAARASLIAFACYVDPAQAQWYRAEHLHQIAGVLERVERGECKRVIIAIPPRHWKSSIASEKFSAWWLGKHNKDSIIVASYALSLAEKFSKSVREMIGGNEHYQELFPDIRIQRDSNSADDWLLESGYRTSFRAVGTGGGISGHGARLILLDDVSDPNKINSQTQTDGDWHWYKNVIRTRLEANGAIVIINNRVGVNDLTGFLLDPERNDSADPPEDWTYVEIPAMTQLPITDEPKDENVTSDLSSSFILHPSSFPRETYLWESRFGREYYEKLRLEPTLWRVQDMQKPTVDSGTEIRREWFEFVPQLPAGVAEQCRVIDTAWTLKKSEKADPDYSASIGSAMHEGWLYLVEPRKWRAELPDVVNWIESEKRLKPRVRFGMARAAGESISKQFLARSAIPIEDLEAETVDLRVRLMAFISFASRGLVKLVGEPTRWEQFLAEATAFPGGKHDDLLACCAGLTQMHGLRVNAPPHGALPKRARVDYRKMYG